MVFEQIVTQCMSCKSIFNDREDFSICGCGGRILIVRKIIEIKCPRENIWMHDDHFYSYGDKLCGSCGSKLVRT